MALSPRQTNRQHREQGILFLPIVHGSDHLRNSGCYLKARFGEPNGFQTFLRRDSSDNWIHWDFNLKAAGEGIWIGGTYREVHFML